MPRHKAGKKAMRWPRQRLQGGGQKGAQDCWQPQKLEEAREDPSLVLSEGTRPHRRPGF